MADTTDLKSVCLGSAGSNPAVPTYLHCENTKMTLIDLSLLKTQPRSSPGGGSKQLEALQISAERRVFALLMEQRTGKTWVIINTAAIAWRVNRIDCLAVIAAPNGVQRVWEEEVRAHLPDDVPRRILVWKSGEWKRKAYAQQMEALLTFSGLAIFAANAEALTTPALRLYVKRLFDARRVLFVGDETSEWAMRPNNERYKKFANMGKHKNVVMRRILDGTPAGNNGPMDMYAPFNWLDPNILRFSTFTAFKNYFAEWEDKYLDGGERSYRTIKRTEDGSKAYRNLNVFAERIAPHSFRALRSECGTFKDKIYQKSYFKITEEQRKLYEELRETYVAELSKTESVTVAHVLPRLLRLQQITSGYWPAERGSIVCGSCHGEGCGICDGYGEIDTEIPARRIGTTNPRLDALSYILTNDPRPAIVWTRFRQDAEDICSMMNSIGRIPVRYDGSVPLKDRGTALSAFQSGVANGFVGSPRAGGRGLRIDRAEIVIYYSNYFSLLARLQSEDRAESPNRAYGTDVIDLIAEDTVDERIVAALRENKAVADVLLDAGKNKADWL